MVGPPGLSLSIQSINFAITYLPGGGIGESRVLPGRYLPNTPKTKGPKKVILGSNKGTKTRIESIIIG